jgi:hypothetical protein
MNIMLNKNIIAEARAFLLFLLQDMIYPPRIQICALQKLKAYKNIVT